MEKGREKLLSLHILRSRNENWKCEEEFKKAVICCWPGETKCWLQQWNHQEIHIKEKLTYCTTGIKLLFLEVADLQVFNPKIDKENIFSKLFFYFDHFIHCEQELALTLSTDSVTDGIVLHWPWLQRIRDDYFLIFIWHQQITKNPAFIS